MEIWKPMFGFEQSHEISNLGRIRNTRGMILKQHPDKRGYLRVKPKNITQKVHRLVAQTFLVNPENKPQVNHKDTDKTNNKADNLEWSTQEENMQHAVQAGIYKNNFGKAFMEKQKAVACYTLEGKFVTEYPSLQVAAKAVNGSASNLHHALNGKIRKHKGFVWKYV